MATCRRHVACRDTIDLRPTDTSKMPTFLRDDTICGRGIVSIACRYARLCAHAIVFKMSATCRRHVGDMSLKSDTIGLCRRHVAEIGHNLPFLGQHLMCDSMCLHRTHAQCTHHLPHARCTHNTNPQHLPTRPPTKLPQRHHGRRFVMTATITTMFHYQLYV